MDSYELQQAQQLINQNNSWNAEQALKQQEFQREMSNTAHQREVADLKAAGLNPVLSASAQGATTPNGAMASSNGSTAMINLMSKMLDVQASNARTLSYAVGSSGVSNWNTSDTTELLAPILSMFGWKTNSKSLNTFLNSANKVGSYISDLLGLSQDSKARQYLSGNWTLNDTINSVKDAVSNVQAMLNENKGNYNSAKTYVSPTNYYKDQNGANFRTSSASTVAGKGLTKLINTVISDTKSLYNTISSSKAVKSAIRGFTNLLK